MSGAPTVERDLELDALRTRLQQAVDGHGSTVTVTGPAGLGRSFLLSQLRELALDSGWTVLDSRCTPTSARLEGGVLRDWLASRALRAAPDEAPYDGPGTAVLDLARGRSVELGPLVYGVRCVVEHLAGHQPLLLVVDDLQWADARSLEVLELLVGAIAAEPCVLVLAVRTGEPTDDEAAEPLRRLTVAGDEIALHPWSRQAVRERVREARRRRAVAQAVQRSGGRGQHRADRTDRAERPGGTDPLADKVSHEIEHTDLLMRRTGGVPFLVEQLLADDAGPGAPVGAGLVASVAERTARLGPSATSTARAVSLLGAYADLTSVAAVTGAPLGQVADDVDALVRAQLLTHDDSAIRVRHPVIGEALIAQLSASESSRLHRRAADVLTEHGADRADVARRLLETLPAADETVRARLHEQGDRWLTEGRADLAARFYERAIAEGPVTETEVELLASLARVHAGAGRLDEALAVWSRARELTTNAAVDDGLRAEAGDALMAAGRHREAQRTLSELSPAAGSGESLTAPEGAAGVQRRHARMALAGLLTGVSLDFLHQQIAPVLVRPPQGVTPEDRLSLAAAAAVTTFEAHDAGLARELTLRSVSQGMAVDDAAEAGLLFLSAGVLLWTSTYVEAEALLTSAITDATAQTSRHRFATASVCRGLVRLRMGLVSEAQDDLEAALAEREHGWTAYLAPLLTGLVECHLARGDLDRALELAHDLEPLTNAPGLAGAYATYGLAELAAASADPDRAATLYSQVGRLVEGRSDNPAILPWRVGESLARIRLGQLRAALHLTRQNLELAQSFGAAYAIAEALRALAAVDATGDRVQLLRRALGSLRGVSAARLEAQVATDLAGMLVLTGDVSDAGEPSVLLRRAESYAAFQELRPLGDRVQRLLERIGEPVKRTPAESISLLTASERKVADLAASGLSNRQIAQQLFVTVKAVEWHLSNTYRKLGIRSRTRLPALLDAVGR